MRRGLAVRVVLVLVWLAGTLTPLGAQLRNPDLVTLLRDRLRLTPPDLSGLEQGQIITRALPTEERREMALFGAIRVQAPSEVFVRKFVESTLKTNDFVLQTGKFSDPPRLEDLQGLQLDQGDVDALRRCGVGECKVRLSADAIRRFNREVQWSTPNAAAEATALFKQILLEYVRQYLAGGHGTLGEYNDHREPVSLSKETGSILRQVPSLTDPNPDFVAYLERFPRVDLPGTESFLYWSKESFGFKPVVQITHVVMHRPSEGGCRLLIAATQLYANHYLDGSVALTAIYDDSRDGEHSAFYMLYLNRSRNARLAGMLGGLTRSIVQGRSRSGLEKSLRLTRERLETSYRTTSAQSDPAGR